MPKNIAKTLKECRISANISVKEISDLLTRKGYKASESTIYSWENGNSQPTPGALLTMCTAYNVDDVLSTFGYDGYKEDGSIQLNIYETKLIEQYRLLDDFGQKMLEYILDKETERTKQLQQLQERIPAGQNTIPTNIIELPPVPNNTHLVEYYHNASAGGGIYIMGNEVADRIEIPNTPENQHVDYAIGVSGNSMEPDFYDGDIALVSQKAELNHGDVGIFIINGNAYIKEYGETELISRNHEVGNIKISEYDNIVCMGKVIGKL